MFFCQFIPTLGILICKDKDNVLAKYSLESSAEPFAVSEYELAKLYPVDFKSSLPTIEEIESELGEIKQVIQNKLIPLATCRAAAGRCMSNLLRCTEGYRARNTATPSGVDTWGNGQEFFINRIPWNCCTSKIVNQVQEVSFARDFVHNRPQKLRPLCFHD